MMSFTKEIVAARTSIIVVRGQAGELRAFHNICRHRGNKLVWTDFPQQEVRGTARQFTCKYHGWRYDLDGSLNFVQQEGEFFDLDKEANGLVPVHCEVWEGFIFVNFADDVFAALNQTVPPEMTARSSIESASSTNSSSVSSSSARSASPTCSAATPASKDSQRQPS